jgi:small-conductance mechanosensitive channel
VSDAAKHLLIVLVASLVALWGIDWLVARQGRRWAARLPENERAVLETRYRLLRRAVFVIVLFMGVVALLFTSAVTRQAAETVLASSAVVGIVVGFAARSTLANFIAGVMIAINQPLRLGDRVSVGDSEGVVEDIGLSYTRLRTADNARVLIPNEQLASSIVKNLTIVDVVQLAQATVRVPLTVDPERVRTVLAEQAAVAPDRAPDMPLPPVTVGELTDTHAVYTVSAWASDAASAGRLAAWLRERCLARLADEGALAPAEELAK